MFHKLCTCPCEYGLMDRQMYLMLLSNRFDGPYKYAPRPCTAMAKPSYVYGGHIYRVWTQLLGQPSSNPLPWWSTLHSPTGFHGLHEDFVETPHGLYVESMDFRGTTFSISHSPHGLHEESMQSPHGVYEDSTWSPQIHEDSMGTHETVFHGLHRNNPWTPHGLSMDCLFYLLN